MAGARPMAAPAERGDLALVPYYTVRDQWVTGIHIVNTSDHTQVVKFRLRRATDGLDALDFNVVMSPKDVYAGFLSDDANGTIAWASPDTSCTAPAAQAKRLTLPPVYRVGAESGYVEIIAMGQAADDQPIALAARHDPETSMPLDCAAVRSNFFADGIAPVAANTTTGAPAIAGKQGVLANDKTYQPGVASASDTTIKNGGVNTYTDSGNVLKVSYFIRDNATGIEFGDHAVHIANFLDLPSITNQEYGIASGDLNGFDFPDLDGTGLPGGAAADTVVRNRFNRLRRADVLGAKRIINEWSANPANGVEMDWVLTLPGQYTMLRLPQYLASLGADRTWVPTIDSAGNPKVNPQCPRQAIAANPAIAAAPVAACDFRDLPLKLTYTAYNREESQGQTSAGTLVVSPQPARAETYLPKVANVIGFGGNSVLGQPDVDVTVNLGQPFGWVEAELESQVSPKVCQWDRSQDSTAPSATAVTLSLDCATSATGYAPVMGFAAWSRQVAANPEASYGRIVEHSYERDPAPRGLRLSAGNAQVTASWEAAPGATGYTLYYSTSSLASTTDFSGVDSVAVSSGSTTRATAAVTGLTNGTQYYFVVIATNAGAQSAASTEATATPRLPAPSGLDLTAGNAEVEARWTAVTNATGYTLYYSTSSLADTTDFTGVDSVTATGGAATATATGLTNGTEYYFRVIATSAGGHESAASIQETATPQLPAPSVPTLTAGNAEVEARWTAVTNATGYTLYYSTSSLAGTTDFTGVDSVTATGGAATATATGLTNGTEYYFRVIATSAGGHESAASTQETATPQLPAPSVPTLTAGNAQVEANWTAVTNATGYTLYYSTSSLADTTDFTGVDSVTATGGTATTATATGLTNGTEYYFRVIATSTGHQSAASTEDTATPQLPAPTGLDLTPGNAQVAASWTAVTNATGYTLYYSTSSLADTTDFTGIDSVTATGGGTSTTATATGLTNGTEYYFRVIATSTGHESAASIQETATPRLPAPSVPILTAGNAQVVASWTAVPNATGYTLYYSTSSLASTTDFTGIDSVTVTGASTTTATATGLTNGTEYYFRVIATSTGHESAASTEETATPQLPAPSVPTLTAGNAQVAASWTAVPNATGYTLYYSTSSLASTTDFTGIDSVTATGGGTSTTTATATGLTNGTEYYFRVIATSTGHQSAASIEASATPQLPAPSVPALTSGNAQVEASWTAVTNATGYTLYYSTSSLAGTTDFTGIDSVTVTGASTTTATATGLTNGTEYYFRVIATSTGHESAASLQASATPQLPAPTGLTLARGNAEVAAVWAQVPNATGYTLYYSTTPLAGTTDFTGVNSVDISGGSTITTLVTGLPNGTLHYFRVIATSAGGHQSAASDQSSATPQLPAPVGLALTPGNAEVAASWLSVPNATSYKLYYSATSLASTTDFSGVNSVDVSGASTTTATATGLTNGTIYYFVVVATTSAGGESAASTEARAAPRLPAPTSLRLARGNAEVAAVWAAVPNATGYRVYYSKTSLAGTTNFTGVPFVDVSGGSMITTLVTGLTNGTQYYFVVVATSAGHQSAASTEASATPQLPAPVGLTVTPGNAQLAASWLPVPNATGYKLYYATSSLAGITDFTGISSVPATGTSATVTGLTNGTTYYFVVVATTSSGGESAASTEARAAPQIPAVGTVFRDVLSGGGQGPQMVALPTGSFSRGSPTTEPDRQGTEGPVRTVTISKRIAMGRYEVTFDDYKRFTDDPATTQTLPGDEGWGRGSRPVIYVNWDDARAYATWLSAQTGKAYRLPTEAEWEYAARAGTTTAYAFGASITCSQASYARRLGSSCNSGSNASLARTVAVGSFPANAFGLYDMHGNVWEWVEDCYAFNYTGAPDNGSARATGCVIPAFWRTIRGGSWTNSKGAVRSATRFNFALTDGANDTGFRLVRELSP